jgi:uncharacterized tellurite resistance protein B-like protein
MPAMSQDPRRLAFLKTLVAAAWADGELSAQEIRTISQYLQRFRADDDEAAEVQALLKRRLSTSEASQILQEQLKVLTTAEEQRTLVAAVEDLLVSDNRLDPQEAAFLRQIRELTRDVSTPQLFVSRLRALWTRAPSGQEAKHGEMSQFLQNRLLEHFRGRIALARARAGLSVEDGIRDADLYRAVIWAGLLSEVARVDASLCPAEQDQLLGLLSVAGTVPRPDLEVIVGAFNDGSLVGLDLGVLVREFLNLVSPDDAALILDGLFLVAAADGKLQDREVSLIRTIAQGAGFPENSFLAAWERCRRRLAEGWN